MKSSTGWQLVVVVVVVIIVIVVIVVVVIVVIVVIRYNDLMASVVPEASPSTDDDGRFRPFKRQHTESLEGEGERPLPPPELPPLPLPPPLNRVPTPLPLRGSSSPESPDYSEVASEDQQSRATPIVPRRELHPSHHHDDG